MRKAVFLRTVLVTSIIFMMSCTSENISETEQLNISHDNFNLRASKISSEADAKEVGENVAKDYISAQDVFDGWINSTAHKENIENDFTHTAISVKKDSNGNLYFTQIFFK